MVTKIKPYNPSASDLVSDWHVLDAKGKVLGRIASEAATLLMGKHRPEYVPHMLSGDFVVIINAADVTVTGNKADQIVYRRHSQKPGKLKEIPYRRVQEKFPERIIEHAVRGMLPRNKLGERMIRRLKVYAAEEHPHVSQLAWTASRPERDAAAAAEAEETAKKRAENRRRTAARREIAEDAAAKASPVTEETETPESSEAKTESPAVTAAAAVSEPEVVQKKTSVKKPAVKKSATKRASTTKSSTTKASTTTASRKKATGSAAKSSTSKSSAAKPKAASKKSPTTRKKPATAKSDD